MSPGQKRGTCGHIMELMHTPSVHVAGRKALAKTPVLKRSSVRFVTIFLNSWPHLYTGHVKSSRRKVKVPVDEWLCQMFEKLNLTVQDTLHVRQT